MTRNYNAPRGVNDNPLSKLRVAKGLTQGKLAELAGLTQQTVSFLERGNLNMSVNTAKKLAAVLGVEWYELCEDRSKTSRSIIAEARRAKGMTQSELAKAVGVSQTTLSHAEAGTGIVSNEVMDKIADVLNITIDANDDELSPIVKARKEIGMTQAKLSEITGILQSTVSWAERDIHVVSEATIEKIANALDIPLEPLLELKHEKRPGQA